MLWMPFLFWLCVDFVLPFDAVTCQGAEALMPRKLEWACVNVDYISVLVS